MRNVFERGVVFLSLLAALALFAGCSGDKKDGADKEDKQDRKEKDGGQPQSGEPPTVITCSHIEDEGCIESLREELIKVEGVAEVKGNISAKTVTVTPKKGVVLSPKALWEAADKSGEIPTRLDGPGGLHTSRPKK